MAIPHGHCAKASLCLNQRKTQLSVQQIVQTNHKANIRISHYWPLVCGIGGYPSQRAGNTGNLSRSWRIRRRVIWFFIWCWTDYQDFILGSQYHCRWWPGDTRTLCITRHSTATQLILITISLIKTAGRKHLNSLSAQGSWCCCWWYLYWQQAFCAEILLFIWGARFNHQE